MSASWPGLKQNPQPDFSTSRRKNRPLTRAANRRSLPLARALIHPLISSGRSYFMTLRVSGKNLDIGDALREQAMERVGEALAKYFDSGYSGHVTVEKEGSGFRTECTLHLDTGATFHVEAEAADAYQSLNRVVERIGKQLRRDKRRRTDVNGAIEPKSTAPVNGLDEDDEPAESFAVSTAIIAEQAAIALPRLSTAQAVARIESGEASTIAYVNPGTKRANIVHRRPDGHIGWIDLAAS
jgi:ribosomal subunit interface protein